MVWKLLPKLAYPLENGEEDSTKMFNIYRRPSVEKQGHINSGGHRRKGISCSHEIHGYHWLLTIKDRGQGERPENMTGVEQVWERTTTTLRKAQSLTWITFLSFIETKVLNSWENGNKCCYSLSLVKTLQLGKINLKKSFTYCWGVRNACLAQAYRQDYWELPLLRQQHSV